MVSASNCFSNDKVFKDKIAEGNASIESCLEEIEDFLKEINLDVKNARKDSTGCHSQERLSSVVKDMIYAVNKNPGLEELLLPHLEEIRKQNRLPLLNILPIEEKLQEQDQHYQLDNTDLCLAWQKLCYHIVNYVKNKLVSIVSGFHMLEEISFRKPLLCFYLKCLSGIVSPAKLWELHKNVRLSVLKQMQCLCSSESQEVCFKCLLTMTAYCIREDKELIYNGYFQHLVITWMEITKTYMHVISSAYTKLLDKVDKMRIADSQCCLNETQMQCFNSLKTSCYKFLENSFLKYVEENSIPFMKIKMRKDLKEYLQKFSLGKNNVICTILLKIIEMTHAFEDSITLLTLEGLHQKNMCYHSNAFECASQGTLLMVPVDSPEQSPVHLVTDDNQNSLPFSWNWRLSFQDLGLLAFIQRHLQELMQHYVQVCLSKEWTLFLSQKEVPSVCIQFSHQGVEKTINVTFSVAVIVRELDKFCPLLSASQGALLPFRSSFNHVLHTYVIEVLSHIERIAATVPQSKPIENLYVISTSTCFIKERLRIYNHHMCRKDHNQPDNSILALHGKLVKLEDALLQKIIYYHRKLLFGGILQDADSHNWSHHKPFFEDSRISFSIQMWNLYLGSTMNDLKQNLPSVLSQQVMTILLDESLQHFAIRYSRATPSEARVNQYRSDIVAILLYTTELLPSVCSSSFQLIGKEDCMLSNDYPNMKQINSIHNHCNMLLTLLAVLTSPLPTLYKVIKKGFPMLSASLRQKVSYNATWLSWIQPAVYPHIGQGALMSSSLVWLNVKLCVSQPEANPFLVIKAFASHSSTLSILFMTQANEMAHNEGKHSPLALKNENDEPKLKLSRVLLSLLQFCYYQPECLADVLTPVIERSKGWKEFDESNIFKLIYQRPWWYRAFSELFKPISKRGLLPPSFIKGVPTRMLDLISILNIVVPLIMEKYKIKLVGVSELKWQELKGKMLEHFDCSCSSDLTQGSPDKSTAARCALDIIICLKDQLTGLPPTLVTCLANLETLLLQCQENISTLFTSLPLQVLLSDLCITLKEHHRLEDLMQGHFSNSLSSIFNNIADTLLAMLHTDLKCDFDEDIIKLAIENANYIKKFFLENRGKGNIGLETNVTTDHDVEDDCLTIITSEFLQLSNGHDYIKYLHHLLEENLAWIQTSLGIPFTLSTDVVVSSVSPSPLPSEEFIHTKEHQKLKNNSESITTIQEFVPNSKDENISYLPGTIIEDPKKQLQCLTSQINLLHVSNSAIQRQRIKTGLNKIDAIEQHEHQNQRLKLDAVVDDLSRRISFNPLLYFNKVGDSPIDQELLANFPFPWESLLDHTPLLGLTETGLKMLLMHRWEFLGKEPLSIGYDKYVHSLKSQYGIDQDDDSYHNH